MTCQTCRFYHPDDGYPETGECHRFPPLVNFSVGVGEGSEFPVVMMTDWCGEYQEKDSTWTGSPVTAPNTNC